MPRTAKPDAALAATLRAMREERGLTREDLAYDAGLTMGALARIELAQSAPAWSTVRQIVRALDVPLIALAAAVEALE
jgi:transcriptional regulator with XRE-family HTH domain